MDEGSTIQAPKVAPPKEAKTRAVLVALEKVRKNGFVWLRVSLDVKPVVQTLKGDYDRSINPIIYILEIKPLASLCYFVDFHHIPRALNEKVHRLAKVCHSISQGVGCDWALGILLDRGLDFTYFVPFPSLVSLLVGWLSF